MKAPLKSCPICNITPDRFFVGQQRIEVIACRKGCKTHVFGFVVHITSAQVDGWGDLGDAWNTMQSHQDESGRWMISFDSVPPHMVRMFPDGPHCMLHAVSIRS